MSVITASPSSSGNWFEPAKARVPRRKVFDAEPSAAMSAEKKALRARPSSRGLC